MRHNLHLLKNLKVLIAEDDLAVLNDMTQMLLIFFKEVLQASDGYEALKIYESEKPDIVLTDIRMPTADGLWLADKIRTVDYDTPIILISSYSDRQVFLQALNMSVNGFIIKPVVLEEMLKTIAKSIKRISEKDSDSILLLKNGVAYNCATKELAKNGICIELGAKEEALLSLFVKNKNKLLRKQDIIDELWPLDEISDSALKSVLNRLRKKVGEEHIKNIKNIGWRLSLD